MTETSAMTEHLEEFFLWVLRRPEIVRPIKVDSSEERAHQAVKSYLAWQYGESPVRPEP